MSTAVLNEFSENGQIWRKKKSLQYSSDLTEIHEDKKVTITGTNDSMESEEQAKATPSVQVSCASRTQRTIA